MAVSPADRYAAAGSVRVDEPAVIATRTRESGDIIGGIFHATEGAALMLLIGDCPHFG